MATSDTEYCFRFVFPMDIDPSPLNLPDSGTLSEAVELCKEHGAHCDLEDEAGFGKGYVTESTWTLSGRV